MSNLPRKTRARSQEAAPPLLRGAALREARQALGPEWRIVGRQRLEREYTFPDFRSALAFANRVGRLAERAAHHPDLTISWGKVRLVTWTHSAGGLTTKDFRLAAGADRAL